MVRTIASFTALLALASAALSKPVNLGGRQFGGFGGFSSAFSGLSSPSFNDWHGISSLDGFDDFYGQDNFASSLNVQTVVSDNVLVCHSFSVEIIQQRLAVLQEFAKRIITEQICDVETQTIVVNQVQSVFSSFGDDIRHISGRHVSFDGDIASHIGDLVDSNGDLTSDNLGFDGASIGSNSVVVGGNNWNPETSPASVDAAFQESSAAL
jgi:hypothetical protein